METHPVLAKAPRKEIRHHWGVHVSEADDKMLQWLQQTLFEQGQIPRNTKYCVIRRCIDVALAAAQKRQAQTPPVAASPVPTPSPALPTNPVAQVSPLQAQIDAAIDAKLRALVQARGGVSQ